ncbi:MAG: transcription antitermination protein NusB [Candidatus Ancillula sp.]|jgi:transcription termination factor NusB|nr:transcription antitermination protein NusB [Candidatus Ancillula sp.]
MSDELKSKITRRKRAFYIVLESLIKNETISKVIEERRSIIDDFTNAQIANAQIANAKIDSVVTANDDPVNSVSSGKSKPISKKWAIDEQVVELLIHIENLREQTEQKILNNVKSNNLRNIPRPDLAILMVLLTELDEGLDLKVALDQGAKLADDFGGTDSSPKFIHAVLNGASTS